MKGKRVLVAGGSGLVGVNLAKKLHQAGAEVLATRHSHPPHEYAFAETACDFTRMEDCLRATRGQEIVFFCAARPFGAKAVEQNPTAALLPNLQIGVGLLEACRVNRVTTVVLLSSTTVYAESPVPLREEDLDLNQPPYALFEGIGWLNRYLERVAAFYARVSQMNIITVRPTSVYGPHDNFDEESSHVIPALIKRALEREEPFLVWGQGMEVRDFLYVEDLADDLLALVDGQCFGEAYNIGSGTPMTIREALETILAVCQHPVRVQYDPTKPRSIPYRAVSMHKLEERLGRRHRTAFREGIEKTVRWYLSAVNERDKLEKQ